MRILFVTGNEGKLREIREIMADLDLPVVSVREAGLSPEIDENGVSFRDNALIKVRALPLIPDTILMADDSGLSIDALDGKPGVHSARFLGEKTPYDVKIAAIIAAMKLVTGSSRSARYTSVVAMRFPDGEERVTEGTMEGLIAETPKGENGFGYDPLFYYPPFRKTAAEMTDEEKNSVSHRGEALRKAKIEIASYLEGKCSEKEM